MKNFLSLSGPSVDGSDFPLFLNNIVSSCFCIFATIFLLNTQDAHISLKCLAISTFSHSTFSHLFPEFSITQTGIFLSMFTFWLSCKAGFIFKGDFFFRGNFGSIWTLLFLKLRSQSLRDLRFWGWKMKWRVFSAKRMVWSTRTCSFLASRMKEWLWMSTLNFTSNNGAITNSLFW